MKKALITGITGQDGSFLAELLLEKGYEVHGIIRRSSTMNTERIEHLYLDVFLKDSHLRKHIHLHYGDMIDSSNLARLIAQIRPNEIYHLAAQSHVKVSFEVPEYTGDVDALGTLRLLEAVRMNGMVNDTKIYQASSSEMYGKVVETPQSEITPFYPRSPYGVAKLYAYWISKNYRESYGMFVANGILFNHESERRGANFVTRKITLGASRIKAGIQEKLYLGNLDALRDWGYAKDYVACMWRMLQEEQADDFVIATGKQFSVRAFCTWAFGEADIDLVWEGEGIHEVGRHKQNGRVLVEVDPAYYRPAEVESLLGNSEKAQRILGWDPNKTPIQALVRLMMTHDMDYVKRVLK